MCVCVCVCVCACVFLVRVRACVCMFGREWGLGGRLSEVFVYMYFYYMIASYI